MIRKTVRWLVVLLGFAGIAVGTAVWFAWTRGDEMLQAELERRLEELAPRCDVQIGRARFDWDRSIRVVDVMIGPKGRPPVLNVPEMVIRIDGDRFSQERAIDVRSIRLMRPRFEVVRRLDGSWSTADLLPIRPPDPSISIPEWTIEGATVRLRLEQPAPAEPILMTLQETGLHIVPAGRRQVIVKGLSGVSDSGALRIAGRVDLDRAIWNLEGSLDGVATAGTVVGFALKSSADLQTQVAKLGEKLQTAEQILLAELGSGPAVGHGPLRTADRGNTQPRLIASTNVKGANASAASSLSDLGLNATVDLRFRLGQREAAPGTDYQVWVDCRDGQVVNPLLPFALRHLRGGLYWDNRTLRLTDVRADGGGTAVTVHGEFNLPVANQSLVNPPADVPPAHPTDAAADVALHTPVDHGRGDSANGSQLPIVLQTAFVESAPDESAPDDSGPDDSGPDDSGPDDSGPTVITGTLSLAVTDLPVSDRYPGRLPPGIERFLQIVRPRGPVDLSGRFRRDETGRWISEALTVTAKGATAVPEPFPYPIHEITGTLVQTEPGKLRAHMVGKAGLRPVTVDAWVLNPGLDAEVSVKISAQNVAIDKTLAGALKPDQRAVLEGLGLGGFADIAVELYRPPGLGQKFGWWLKAKLQDGELEYDKFPYRLTQLSGDIVFNSETETWSMLKMNAVHDRAKIGGYGTYRKPDHPATSADEPPPGLVLKIDATQVGLGDDLRAALPNELKMVWEELQPGGTAEIVADVAWRPGIEPDIRLSTFKLENGNLEVRAFPYALDTIRAQLSYAPGLVTIQEFVGWHDETLIRTAGGRLVRADSGEWLLDLPDIYAEKLQFGRAFRRAVPEGLRDTIETLDPRGPMTVSGALQIRGGADPSIPLTAGWDLEAELADTSLAAGPTVEHMHGVIRCRGNHDGVRTRLNGSLALNRADIWGNRIEDLRGPFRFGADPETGLDTIEFGTRSALRSGLQSTSDPKIPRENHITASYLGGLLTFDSLITLADPSRGRELGYMGRVELNGGRLERYIPRLTNARNLAGVLTGDLNFQGAGTDSGGLTGRGQLRIAPAALYELPVVMQMFSVLTSLSPSPPNNTAFTSARIDFLIGDRRFTFPFIDLDGEQIRFVGRGEAGFDEHLRLDFYSTLPNNQPNIVPVIGPLVRSLISTAATGWIGIEVTGKISAPVARAVPAKALDDTMRQFLESLGPPGRQGRTASGFPTRR